MRLYTIILCHLQPQLIRFKSIVNRSQPYISQIQNQLTVIKQAKIRELQY